MPRTLLILLTMLAAATLGVVADAAAQARRAAVEFELRQFGVNSNFRPGDITPMQLALRIDPASDLPEAVPVRVQWEVPNADGDIVEFSRPVTLTRGRDTLVWLYAPLLPEVDRNTIWPVRVFEMRDGRRRGELGGRRIRPGDAGAQNVPITNAMIGVIGPRLMRLNDYSVTFDQPSRSPAAHEQTRIIGNIQPEQLPDRWEGLMGFEAIAWGEALPQRLSTDAATALREYVRRGGHLIISLPEDTNPWQFGVPGQTPLDDLLPQREPRKDEAVPIRDLVPVLSKAETTEADFTYGIRVFRDLKGDFNSIERPYRPLITMPDGRVVAIHRTYGHGHITIIGIDLSQQRLYAVPLSNGARGLPQGDAFWNRLLGRRVDTPSATDLEAIRREDMLSRPTTFERDLGAGGLFSQQISMSSQAGAGLLLALTIFITYWVIAGPGGFGLLKLYKQAKHAWLAFAGAAIAFTLLAWASVSAIRINEPQVQHVTFLDHIARPGGERANDPQLQRAVSWFSLYIPGYGQVPISIRSETDQRNLLSCWTPPGETVQRFPNVDRYSIDVRTPSSFAITSRSTATHMYANWLGGLDPDWGGMIREHGQDTIEVRREFDGRETGLAGTLYHDLPGTLRDVTLIWVRNARMPERRYARSGEDGRELPLVPLSMSGQMLNLGYHLRLDRDWEPGAALNLRELRFDPPSRIDLNIERRYVEDERRLTTVRAPGITALRAAEQRRYMEMLSMFHLMTPPDYLRARRDASPTQNNAIFQRQAGRELDLSPWFNQPCIIIIGYLENTPTPIPLRVGDHESPPESSGLTVVRWIYPLPLLDELAFADVFRNDDRADAPFDFE